MRKILVFTALGLACCFAHAEDCALLLFPETGINPETFSARFTKGTLQRAFPTGLFPFTATVRERADKPTDPVLDEIEITSEIPLPGLPKSTVTFAQLWYRALRGNRSVESSAKYSVVQLTETVERRQSWIIEHPERGLLGKADDFYAPYNADRDHTRPTEDIPLKPVANLKAARLSMYLAAISAPKIHQIGSLALWTRPVLRPMMISQSCVGEDCMSRVKVRVVYSHFEKFSTHVEGGGELQATYEFNVRTRNGKLLNVRSNRFEVQEIDPRLVAALEEIAARL